MFELVQCKQSGIVHETMTFDQTLMRFRGSKAEGLVNGWIGTCRAGEVLEVTVASLVIVCIE